MRRPIVILFAVLICVAATFVAVTADYLPDPVATSFGARGFARAYMSRSAYRVYLLCFTVGLPLFIVALVGGLPRLFPDKINIPNREYWLASARRAQTLTFLSTHAFRLGCLLLVFMIGIQGLVIQANTHNPPQLANVPFIILMVGLFVSISGWLWALFRRFRQSG